MMKTLALAIAAVLLVGTISVSGAQLAAKETEQTAAAAAAQASAADLPLIAETKVDADCADDVLILMKADTCTDEQLCAVLEKYGLTVLQAGSVIPFCTVQLSSPLDRTGLEALCAALENEEGILSAMPDTIIQLD